MSFAVAGHFLITNIVPFVFSFHRTLHTPSLPTTPIHMHTQQKLTPAMTMSKVLVVGGSTYMGYHMSNHLNDNFDITAIYTTEDDGWNTSRP